ncbi:MAG: hypothetical protein RJB39_268, partial [Candidatus Parcubacteria bacterium]
MLHDIHFNISTIGGQSLIHGLCGIILDMKSHSHAQEGLESGVTTPHNEVIVQELKTLRLKIEAQKAKINAEPLQKKRIQLARTLVRLQDEEQDLLQQLGQGEEITVVEEPAPRAAVLEPESPTEEPAVVDDRGLVPSELIPPAIFVENPPVVAETPLAELVDGASAPAPEVMTGEPTDLINMAMIESLAPEDTDTPADRKSKIELLEVVRGKLRAVRTQLVSKTKAEAAGELDRWQRTIDLLKPINEHLDALQALSKPGYTPGKASHTHHPHPTPYHTEPRIHPGHQNAPYNPPHHAESAANRRIKILPNITKLTKMVLGNTELESATDTEQTLREKLDTLEESLRRFNTIMAKVGDEATAAANKNTRYRNDLLDKMTELEDRKKELETALKAKKKADPKPRQKKKFTLIEKIAPLASIEALKADILDDVITLQDNEASLETMLEALSTELQSLGNKVYAEQSDKGALYTALQERIKIVQTAHNLVSDLIEAKSSDEGRLANGIGPTQEIIGSHPIFPSVEYMADVQGIVDDVEFSATDSLETLKDCRTRLAEQRSILKTSQEEMKTQKNAVENNIATRWYFVTHELAHIQKRLIELNDLIYEKEGEEVDENPKTAEFLDEVRGSRAPYGNRFEDLMMVIGQDMRSVSPEILDGLVQASHEELEGLFEVVNEGGDDHLDALLKLRDKKNQHYFRYYLQVVWQKAEALKRSINRKNSIRNLPGFISLKTQINRLARMCKENSIPLMQNSADYEMDKSEKRAKEAADQAAALAAAGGTPTPVPIPGTTPPTPPVQPPTPNPIPTPRPRTMTLEDLIIMPAVMPIEIESDIQFNQWYASIQSRYDAVGYPFDATISRPLEAWYEQYKSYEPTLDRARGFLNNGSLDVALGITKKLEPGQTTEQRKKKEVLDAGSIGILRDQAFERLQYEIFMKGEAGQRRLEEIFTSIEQARQNNETITALEAKLKAQEKILALRKGMKVGAEEAVVVVEDNPEEFKSNNVNYIRRFVEDMKHNFRFYAAAAPTMISDGAKDKIFDRYYAAHGGVETEGKKLGFFSRLGTRLLNRVGKILPIGRAAARAGEILTGAEMTKRQEEKNRFWAIMEILKKNKLIPT